MKTLMRLAAASISALAIFTLSPEVTPSAFADNCPASAPGVACAYSPITDPLYIWARCSLVDVDVVQKSFTGSNKNDWFDTISGAGTTPGAIDGWNAAFHAPFGVNLFREVGGRPYDVKFHNYSESKFRRLFGPDSSARSLHDESPIEACCGDIRGLTRVRIYIRNADRSTWTFTSCGSDSSWNNARRLVFHELGHALRLQDERNTNSSLQSLMAYGYCATWPTSADGEMVKCLYYQYRDCTCE